jgi:steroid 5-alpha reductase family enzyme
VTLGARLAIYISARSRGQGDDPRYTNLLDKAPGSRVTYALRKVFLLQAALIWLISIPV